MSSPTSDASSSRDSLDDHNDTREQSTKDRRRERNRLAAQKHRLRRNERMSQLEQQVLALQQEKHQLLAKLDDANAQTHAVAAAAGVPPPADIDLDLAAAAGIAVANGPGLVDPHASPGPRPAKRARTATDLRDRERDAIYSSSDDNHTHHHNHHHNHAAQAALVRRMEERILELERWSEDLNGDLTDALDSEARLKTELHHTQRHADAHARRLADALHHAEAEGTRHARELADVRDALATEAARVSSLREDNTRLHESLEGAEVTLDLQRVENERLRDRLAAEDRVAASALARLEQDLAHARGEAEDLQEETRRLRGMLRSQEASEQAAAAARARQKQREEDERRHAEEREAAAHKRIDALNHSLSEVQTICASQNSRIDKLHAELDASEQARDTLNDRVGSLQGALEKVRAFLASKGIPIELD